MEAPNLEKLYDVENAVEAAWVEVLDADGITAFSSISEDLLTLPRVDVTCKIGKPTGHRGQVSAGVFAIDAWEVTMSLVVKTKRVDGQPALHAQMVAKIRSAAQYLQERFGEAALPYHCFSMIQQASTDRGITDEEDLDFSEIQFDAIVSIRTDAWPS